ncbi:MAG: CpsD/CapB family tyrosine-protein kinase [Bacteroidales bacterium]|nr:CpsD/CapB family tyrosine-protein kinase [Bacteroidales bacterium]
MGNGPIYPKKLLTYIFAIVLSFLVVVVVIHSIEAVSTDTINSTSIKEIENLNLLGQVYHNRRESEKVIIDYPNSSVSESFRSLRSNLDFHLQGEKNKVLLVTSTFGKEGKSFNSMNIGYSLAINGYRTLLISFDLRKPRIHEPLKIANNEGVSSFLIGKANLEDIILPIGDNIDFIPSGTPPPNPSELINSGKTAELFKFAKQNYDYIIIDTPPIGLVSDAYELMKYSDFNVYVTRNNFTPRKDFLNNLKELIKKNNVKYAVVMNDVDISELKSRYHYGYYDSKK